MGLILKCKEMRENIKHCLWQLEGSYHSTLRTDLQILNKVVEHSKPFWILTVLNVDQGPDFGSLRKTSVNGHCEGWNRQTSNAMWSFPTRTSSSCFPTMFFFGQFVSSSLIVKLIRDDHTVLYVLCDFTGLDDPFEFFHNQGTNPHYISMIN
jgi:hypothetical protein